MSSNMMYQTPGSSEQIKRNNKSDKMFEKKWCLRDICTPNSLNLFFCSLRVEAACRRASSPSAFWLTCSAVLPGRFKSSLSFSWACGDFNKVKYADKPCLITLEFHNCFPSQLLGVWHILSSHHSYIHRFFMIWALRSVTQPPEIG